MRGQWGALAVVLALASAVPSCQDGYPIEPTLCDRYCDLGIRTDCGGNSPSECVAFCESSPAVRACPGEFDDWVTCAKAHHYGLTCGYGAPLDRPGCETSRQAYFTCLDAHGFRVDNNTE